MIQYEEKGDNPQRWVQISAVLLLMIVALGIITISAGYFDPKPIGDLQHTYRLDPLSVNARSSITHWLDEPTITTFGTVRLLAAYDHGEIDSGYGLAVGNDQDQVILAISPTGYLTIQRWSESKKKEMEIGQILPWQTWPHLHPNNSENEIWVDFEDGFITSVRINQELLWMEKIPLTGKQIGLAAQSFGEVAHFNFISIQHYAGDK